MSDGGATSTSRRSRRFEGRTALVTGAGGDIGRTAATALAVEGATLVLADIGGCVDATAVACAEANPSTEPVVLRFDVTDEADVQGAFEDLAARGATADLLFNNAGYQGTFGNVADYEVGSFRRVLDVNLTGVFLVMRGFARALIAAGRPGAVVNTASMARGGAPNMVAYSASKAGVIALTKTAAKDLAQASIRVNSISPAFIGPGALWDRQVQLQAGTPSQYFSNDPAEVAEQMIGSVPLRRYGTLDEVVAAALFLLSDESSYITGVDLEVAGGVV